MSKFLVSIWSFLILCIVRSQGQNCRPTGYFRASSPPQGQCSSNCCVGATVYFTFQCSPDVAPTQTAGILTLRTFQKGSVKCTGARQYLDNTPVVALSTGWYSGGARCAKNILVRGQNGKTVKAEVVDECDSTKGCGAEEGYHPPCGYNVVAGSSAVWRALGVPRSQWGQLNITWSDA